MTDRYEYLYAKRYTLMTPEQQTTRTNTLDAMITKQQPTEPRISDFAYNNIMAQLGQMQRDLIRMETRLCRFIIVAGAEKALTFEPLNAKGTDHE